MRVVPVLLSNEEKSKFKLNLKLNFVNQKQIHSEMNDLLKHYGANKSQADLAKTHSILKRFGNITDELAAMRDENR